MIRYIHNIILLIISVLFLFASSCGSLVVDGNNYPLIRNILILIISTIIIFKHKCISLSKHSIMSFVWYIFVFFVIISLFINAQNSIIEGLKLLLVPLVYFNIFQFDKSYFYLINMASVVNGYLIILYSLSVNKILPDFYYSGIFNNPNTFGASMTVFTIASLCCLLISYDKNSKFFYFFILSGIIGLYFESLSYCRTGLLTCCFILCLVIFYFYNTLKNSLINKVLICFLVISILYSMRIYYSEISEFVLLHVYKWSYDEGTISSSGRFEYWSKVFNNITILGVKPDFLPHNQFIGVTYYYGILAGIVFSIFHLLCLLKSIFSFVKTKNIDSFVASIWIITLCMISMLEESLGFTGREWLILGYVSIGYIDKHLTWV